MFRASVERSRFLTTLQPGKKASLSIGRFAGKGVSSLMKMSSFYWCRAFEFSRATWRLELPRGQPSAVDETREECQKDCANHGNDGRAHSSPASAQTCGLHEKAARHCSPDAHRNVHDRAVSVALKNLSS